MCDSVDLKIAVNSDLRRYELSTVHINQSLVGTILVSDVKQKNTDNREFFQGQNSENFRFLLYFRRLVMCNRFGIRAILFSPCRSTIVENVSFFACKENFWQGDKGEILPLI